MTHLPLTPSPVDSPARKRLPPLLRQSWYGLNQAFRRRIKHLSATPDQFTALRILMEGDPAGMTQRDLAEVMSSDPNTIASLLERMESSGLVERTRHERDKRAHRIKLLAKGRKNYEALRLVAVELQSEVLSALPEEARDPFLTQLSLVAEACRSAAKRSGTGAGSNTEEKQEPKLRQESHRNRKPK